MSCGALVLTTDAPPMNEIVTEERGILMGVRPGAPHGLVRKMYTTPEMLTEAVERALALSDSDYHRLCGRARSWFEVNARSFHVRFLGALDAILADARGRPA